MLKLTSDDKTFIENSYKSFLYNLIYLFKNSEINNALDCYKILCNMLRNGQFCIEGTISFNDSFEYLPLADMDYSGVQVMYGVCCCRHASEFIYDILALLGFNASIYYVHVDENKSWHPCPPVSANHVAILLIENTDEYILDPMNNFILRKGVDQSLIPLNSDISTLDMQKFVSFSDDRVQIIGRVLKKYYQLQSLGINHIYDYNC